MRLFLILLTSTAYATTPSFGTLAVSAASPNSATVAATITNGVSVRAECGTDNVSFPIVAPWIAVGSTSATPVSMIAAQLQPATAYYCRLNATDATLAPFAAQSGNAAQTAGGALTTLAARNAYSVKVTQGNDVFYNSQYPAHSEDGDTWFSTATASGRLFQSGNDGLGPDGVLNSSIFLVENSVLNPAISTTVHSATNGMSANGNFGAVNTPACWSDGYTGKTWGLTAEGNTLYWWHYRQDPSWSGTGALVYGSWIMRSDDYGAHWCNPATMAAAIAAGHPTCDATAWGYNAATVNNCGTVNTTTCASTGNPACPGVGVMWAGTTVPSDLMSFVETAGQLGGATTSPIDGMDAYRYIVTMTGYVLRKYRPLDWQTVTNWEAYVGAVGGDMNLPANWSTTQTSVTAVIPAPPGVNQNYPIYLADFGTFLAPQILYGNESEITGTVGSVWYSQAKHLSGPWTTTQIGNQSPGVNWQHETWSIPSPTYLSNRNFISLMSNTYSLTGDNPPAATITMSSGGGYNRRATNPHNPYATVYTPLTISAVPTHSGSVHNPTGDALNSRLAISMSESFVQGNYYGRGLNATYARLWDMFDQHGQTLTSQPIDYTTNPAFREGLKNATSLFTTSGYSVRSVYGVGGSGSTRFQSPANTIAGINGDVSFTSTIVATMPADVNTRKGIYGFGKVSNSAVDGQWQMEMTLANVGDLFVWGSLNGPQSLLETTSSVVSANNTYVITVVHQAGLGGAGMRAVNYRIYVSGAQVPATVTNGGEGATINIVDSGVGSERFDFGNGPYFSRTFGGTFQFVDWRPGTVLTDGQIFWNYKILKQLMAGRGVTVQ